MSNNIAKSGAALITGAAKRIGREIALNLAAKGYDIIISYNNSKEEAEELAEKIHEKFDVKCETLKCDLRDKNQVIELAHFTKEKFPKWSLLINNASIFNKSKFITGNDDELMDNFNTHLISPLILTREFAKHVEENSVKNAHIINMIDKNIVRYDTSYFYYLLSKKSLAEFTKMVAVELAPKIRVNAIAPGFILNPVDKNDSYKNTETIIQKIPLQKKGDVANIWQAIEMLLLNEFVTGQILFIDGGASLNHAG